MKQLIEIAKSCLNKPYIWSSKNPIVGLDCSGLVEYVFMTIGFDPPGVNNAQMFYDHFVKPENGLSSTLGEGALCFYGASLKEISHIALMINNHQIIEAGGGDHTTTSVEAANARNAYVRIRPFGHRKDLLDVIMPKYPDWVSE